METVLSIILLLSLLLNAISVALCNMDGKENVHFSPHDDSSLINSTQKPNFTTGLRWLGAGLVIGIMFLW